LLCIEQEGLAERDERLEIPEDNLADGQRIAHSGFILFPSGRITGGISGQERRRDRQAERRRLLDRQLARLRTLEGNVVRN
jgi:hypothetical protein